MLMLEILKYFEKYSYPTLFLGTLLVHSNICDWLWENPPLTHKDEYLEICNSIIESLIS